MQLRKIKQFEEDFDTTTFAEQAQDIYIEANDLLQKWVTVCKFRVSVVLIMLTYADFID